MYQVKTGKQFLVVFFIMSHLVKVLAKANGKFSAPMHFFSKQWFIASTKI
jgi:hypothetical protein